MKSPFCPDEKYHSRIIERLSYTEYVDEFDPPRPDDVVIMGVYSRKWKNERKRQVLKHKAVTFNGYLDSPTSHTRDYLRTCYTPKKSKTSQREILQNRRMPLYSRPCVLLDASYVDITSAWFSILSIVGWDCEYWPGRWFGQGAAPVDFPLPSNKVARSALVSLARSSHVPVWRSGGTKLERMFNPIENPHIFAVIADVLNAIAHIAVSAFDCVYVATDGFILPTRKAGSFMEFIEQWGLNSRVKAYGNGFVFGPGSYYVGPMRTIKLIQAHRILDCIDHDINIMWMLKRIERCKSNVDDLEKNCQLL